VDEVCRWLSHSGGQPESTVTLFRHHAIDGVVLLSLSENDLKSPPISMSCFGDMRRLIRNVDALRNQVGVFSPSHIHSHNIPSEIVSYPHPVSLIFFPF
jgi:hypothetical protein